MSLMTSRSRYLPNLGHGHHVRVCHHDGDRPQLFLSRPDPDQCTHLDPEVS